MCTDLLEPRLSSSKQPNLGFGAQRHDIKIPPPPHPILHSSLESFQVPTEAGSSSYRFAGFHSFFIQSLIHLSSFFIHLIFFSAFKMFSKLFSLALIAGLTLQVSAHAVINPALGVTGTARRADAKRPSTAAPCGKNVNVAQTLAASTAVTLNGDSFTTTVTNFNG